MRKSVLITLAIILSVVALGVSMIFILKFGFDPLPDTKAEWGAAGDYFGGFLNPIIGLINVLVLIYISLLVSKKDDQRWSNDMIHSAHEELLAEIGKIEVGSSRSVYDELSMFLLGFTYRNRWLFGKEEEVFIKVVREYGKSLTAVSTSAMLINVDKIDINRQFTRIIKNDEGLVDFDINLIKDHCMKVFINDECRLQLVNFLRATMMNRSIKGVIAVDKISTAKKDYDVFFEMRKKHLSR